MTQQATPKPKKKFQPRLIGRAAPRWARPKQPEEEASPGVGGVLFSLFLLFMGGFPLFMLAQVPIVTCSPIVLAEGVSRIYCWVDYRLFGLIPVSQISLSEAWARALSDRWGWHLFGIYFGGLIFVGGSALLVSLLPAARLRTILTPAIPLLLGLSLGYMALLIPTLACQRIEPTQVHCQEGYRLAGLLPIGRGRLIKEVRSATFSGDSVRRTVEVTEDGRSTGRTKQVTYTSYFVTLTGSQGHTNWLVFDHSANQFPWDGYVNGWGTQHLVDRLNRFIGDPTQTSLTLWSIKWLWRIMALGVSGLVVYFSARALVRAVAG